MEKGAGLHSVVVCALRMDEGSAGGRQLPSVGACTHRGKQFLAMELQCWACCTVAATACKHRGSWSRQRYSQAGLSSLITCARCIPESIISPSGI